MELVEGEDHPLHMENHPLCNQLLQALLVVLIQGLMVFKVVRIVPESDLV